MICLFSIILFSYKVIAPKDDMPSCERDSSYYASYYKALERIYNSPITKNDKRLDDFSDCAVKYWVDSKGRFFKSQFVLELTRCCHRIDHPDCKNDWKTHILDCAFSFHEEIYFAARRAWLRKEKQKDSSNEIFKNINNIYYGKNKEWLNVRQASEYFYSFYEAFERYPKHSQNQVIMLSDLDDFSECAVQYIINASKNFSQDELELELNGCCNKNNDEDCESEWIVQIANNWYKNDHIFLPAYNRAISREKDKKFIVNTEDVNLELGERPSNINSDVKSDIREKNL